jgi:hypothetical protein
MRAKARGSSFVEIYQIFGGVILVSIIFTSSTQTHNDYALAQSIATPGGQLGVAMAA